MPTAQEHFDGMDKEAIMLNNLAHLDSNNIPLQGAKIGRLPNNFGTPAPKIKQTAGLMKKPETPRVGLAVKATWPKQTSAKYKPAGGSAVPSVDHIRI